MTETYCGHCMLNIRWDEVAGWWVHWIDDDPTFSKHRCSDKFAQVATPVEQVEAETEDARVRPGWQLIRAERMRQRVEEGRTLEHDDEHEEGEMMRSAMAYLKVTHHPEKYVDAPPDNWPWEAKWWKPSEDPIRNLVKAGALIAAEIDRLQRLR